MACSEEKKYFWKTLKPTIGQNDLPTLKWLADLYPPGKITSNISIAYPQDYVNLLHVTNFLPTESTSAQRLWHIRNNLNNAPTCKACDNKTKWHTSKHEYAKFCSKECYLNDKKLPNKIEELPSLQKYKNTCIKKYGVDNYFKSEDFKVKITSHNLQKHGVTNYVQSEEFKQKKIETNIKKYGVEHHMQNAHFKQSVTSPFTRADVKTKIKQKFLNNYGCHPTQKHFSLETLNNLNSKEWLLQKHVIEKLTLTEISTLLENYDISSISDKMKSLGIHVLNHMRSIAEKEIYEWLCELNFNIITNTRNIIAPYELDIFIPNKNMAIEYCGLYWHSDERKNNKYHQLKHDLCKSRNIRLLTIFEDEWLEKKDLVKNKILHIMGLNSYKKIYARNTVIKEVTVLDKKIFFNQTHIQGDGPSSLNYGLFYNDELVACIGFIRCKKGFILNRYSTKYNIIGGFTKLLNYFEKLHNLPYIETFADLRWSVGELYEKCGFTKIKFLPPDYYWVKGESRWHKFNFRHAGMQKKLSNYDNNLSENQNMVNNGYCKIFDCGKIKYIKNNF